MMSLQPEKIRPNDPRVKRQYATINGVRWSYLDALPQTQDPKGTIFLIHGFPDLSFGWRYQIPLFLQLDFRCIALDCMGYGETGTSQELRNFGFKAHADAVAGIAKSIGVHKIVVCGHDWGGLTVYRIAQWYPDLVTHVISVCTPFVPPSANFISTEQLAKTVLPQFGYQLQFGSADGTLEKAVHNEARMRKFLKGLYGGPPKSGKRFMDPTKGVDLSMIEEDEFDRSPLLSDEEFDHYISEYMKNPFSGPCNWYRTRKINWEDETKLPDDTKAIIKQPTLYIMATDDIVLTKEMAQAMDKSVPNLTRGEVHAGHWALWQTPAEVNGILKEWIEGVVLDGKSKL